MLFDGKLETVGLMRWTEVDGEPRLETVAVDWAIAFPAAGGVSLTLRRRRMDSIEAICFRNTVYKIRDVATVGNRLQLTLTE